MRDSKRYPKSVFITYFSIKNIIFFMYYLSLLLMLMTAKIQQRILKGEFAFFYLNELIRVFSCFLCKTQYS